MGATIYPTVPVAQPEAEPWPIDEHTIRLDEMFARQLDTEFASGVRDLLHDPETGLSALKGEPALVAIAEATPALWELKDRTLAQATGPRQRSLLERMVDARIGWAEGAIGRLARRATMEVDDQSVADRLAGLNRDAATAWRDPAHLRRLGRTAVNELRYQGERRGWDATETEAKVRGGLSNLYTGAVEAALGGDDLDGAAALYEHARVVIDPGRQAVLDHRFERAREVALYRAIDRRLADLPLDPAGPPGQEVFQQHTIELIPDDATNELRDRVADIAAFARRRAERQWREAQSQAGLAALNWLRKNPDAPLLAIPSEVRDWLAPDQWQGLATLAIDGRLKTDGDLFDRLDRQAVYEPEVFADIDLARHRLQLADRDFDRLAAFQRAEVEGRSDPAQARWAHVLAGLDRVLAAKGIDLAGPTAREARAQARDDLAAFETIDGGPPRRTDLDDIVRATAETVEPPFAQAPPSQSDAPEAMPGDVFGGVEPRVIHHDDGGAEVTSGAVPTPVGPAATTVRIDRDRRAATAEMVLPDGRRVESRRSSSDGQTWSQTDTIRDPRGAAVGTQTTVFDGTRVTWKWEPADGPAQTSSREISRSSGDVHLASDEAVLGLGALGATAAMAAAPAVAAAIVVGLGLFAAYRAYEHFTAPGGNFGGSEMARPKGERPGKGHNNPPGPVDDDKPSSPPPSGPPVPPFLPGQQSSSGDGGREDVARYRQAKSLGLKAGSPTTQRLLDNWDMQVDEYISKYMVAGVRNEIPTDVRAGTIGEALRTGTSKIRKILTQERFMK